MLLNPSILSVFPFLAGWAVWRSRTLWLPRVRIAAVTGLVFAIALVPWTARNYRAFGKFIVLRSNFGLEFWLGNNPGVPDTWSPWLHPNDSREEAEKYRTLGEVTFMEQKNREAVEFVRTHPADTLRFIYRRFVNTWLSMTDSPVDEWRSSPWYVRGFMVLNLSFSLFTWLGVLYATRTKFAEVPAYLAMLLIFPLVFYLTHSSLRYRFPMDPIMMVLAAYGVAHPISLWAGRTAAQPRAITPAPPAVAD